MLCLPLGGVSLYEALAAYLGLILSVVTFGMISLAASSYFRRTSAALVVSYLLILPLALAGIGRGGASRAGQFAARVRRDRVAGRVRVSVAWLFCAPPRGCCIRPTSAARARRSSTSRSRPSRPWAW